MTILWRHFVFGRRGYVFPIVLFTTIFIILQFTGLLCLNKKPPSADGEHGALKKNVRIQVNCNRTFGFPHRYSPPYDMGIVGRNFEVSSLILEKIGLPLSNFVTLDHENVREFTVVTAATERFFPSALDAIGTVQYYLPNQPIIFYDLGGLDISDVEKVNQLCSVTYRKFDATLFGSKVWSKRSYAWKPIIIHEVLKEFPGVFWIDTSVRFSKTNLDNVFRGVLTTDGSHMMASTGHSIYSATHPQMYEYLPTQISKIQNVDMHEAGCLLIYRTKEVYDNIIRWWVLCALDSDCIAPTTELRCNDIYKEGRKHYANCHRFDQSALNILMANHFDFKEMSYFTPELILEVKRGVSGKSLVNICKPEVDSKWVHANTLLK